MLGGIFSKVADFAAALLLLFGGGDDAEFAHRREASSDASPCDALIHDPDAGFYGPLGQLADGVVQFDLAAAQASDIELLERVPDGARVAVTGVARRVAPGVVAIHAARLRAAAWAADSGNGDPAGR